MQILLLKLLGLARACDNNEHMLTDDTFTLVRDALDADAPDAALLQRIHDEKYRVVPMCADCPSPCGRTADPDESIFATPDVLSIDKELLQRLIRCGLPHYGESETLRLIQKLDLLL